MESGLTFTHAYAQSFTCYYTLTKSSLLAIGWHKTSSQQFCGLMIQMFTFYKITHNNMLPMYRPQEISIGYMRAVGMQQPLCVGSAGSLLLQWNDHHPAKMYPASETLIVISTKMGWLSVIKWFVSLILKMICASTTLAKACNSNTSASTAETF